MHAGRASILGKVTWPIVQSIFSLTNSHVLQNSIKSAVSVCEMLSSGHRTAGMELAKHGPPAKHITC